VYGWYTETIAGPTSTQCKDTGVGGHTIGTIHSCSIDCTVPFDSSRSTDIDQLNEMYHRGHWRRHGGGGNWGQLPPTLRGIGPEISINPTRNWGVPTVPYRPTAVIGSQLAMQQTKVFDCFLCYFT
jgi:hypothetical protein